KLDGGAMVNDRIYADCGCSDPCDSVFYRYLPNKNLNANGYVSFFYRDVDWSFCTQLLHSTSWSDYSRDGFWDHDSIDADDFISSLSKGKKRIRHGHSRHGN